MFLDAYQKDQINEFLGLYDRGGDETVPKGFASVFTNFATRGRKKETNLRPGTKQSINVAHNVVRMFEAHFLTTGGVASSAVLTCDGAGNIYKTVGPPNVTTVLYNNANLIDFVAINLFNHVFILPIVSVYGSSTLLVWDGTNAIRPALGTAPANAGTHTQAAGGNISSGSHQFAVCFVTSTGFITPPSTITTVNFTSGNGTDNVTAIPTGPAGTVQRIFLATKSNLSQFFFVGSAQGGVINDNTTLTATLNFLDTDLSVDATYLFNLKSSITAATTDYGGAGLAVYKGRLVILDGTTTNQVQVSSSGLPENFDSTTGLITIDYQQDQLISAFEYFGTLYISGNTGIHSTADNGGNPNTWNVQLLDIGNGIGHYALINVLNEKYSGPLSSSMLVVTREGVYIFNGAIQRPCLSVNIQDVFDSITHGHDHSYQIAVDLTRDTMYILIPTGGSTTPNTLIVGDFSDGLNADSIQWATYTFPFTPQCIMITVYNDGDDFDYWLRLGTSTDIKKLTDKATDDSGTAITATFSPYLYSFAEGSVDIFRFIRLHCSGSGTVSLQLNDVNGGNIVNPPSLTLGLPYLGRQINYTQEKMKVTFTYTGSSLTIRGVEVFGRERWKVRPQ